MVFKDAALTPEELPKTTPVPNPHGRLPTGVSWEPLGAPGSRRAARTGLGVERHIVEEEGLLVDPLSEDLMVVNIGPSHPAMHGTFRLKCWLDGETIVKAIPEIGYLHRCFEKMAELHPWQEIFPYTDRLNYMSSFLNNVGYAMAVEKLLGIEVPKRAQRIRVILGELSRIMDHFVCVGTNLVDLGALTNFWYLFRGREEIYSLMEHVSGARMMVAYGRIGGLMRRRPRRVRGRGAGAAQVPAPVHRRRRPPDHRQPDLHRPLPGSPSHQPRRGDRLGLDRPLSARRRRAV